ncbi:tryptophan synthase subunit beta [Balneatrix alpica]|uniref:tryptophan synthase subunit beta n=1 Tax=Balneatrix alpica TaxID=75684 RepID=UPI0027386226|nr:tryptophan synthase subunit beta [Balneatrix alpica]
MLRAEQGFFGRFGGSYIPEILQPALEEVRTLFYQVRDDQAFWAEFYRNCQEYSGRPTPLTPCRNLSERLGGPQIWLKREDLNHSGAHKINNVIGQALLVKRLGKTRVIAETGAGQHGLATALIAARFGLQACIYMGADDVERQYSNVFWMRQLGAEVIPVQHGGRTLKEAMDEALRDWAASSRHSHYLIGTACGPEPFPEMVSHFQSVIGQELQQQSLQAFGQAPERLYACVGGGSNALGAFSGFLTTQQTELVGVEAAGKGADSQAHSIRFNHPQAAPGIAQGFHTLFLQDDDGQLIDTHSIAAGLDYVGVSPILADLHEQGRFRPSHASDDEVISAFSQLLRLEGIIPALESTHALAAAIREAGPEHRGQNWVINLSGRGDKDIFNVARALPTAEWPAFLQRELQRLGDQP